MKALTIADSETVILGLHDEIRRSDEARYDHRLHGVLLVAQGKSPPEVASLLGDSARTVEYWVHRFEAQGLAGLREGERSGRPSVLNSRQLERVDKALRQRPCDHALTGNIWDGPALQQWLKDTFQIHLSTRSCQRLFRRLNYRLRKPHPEIAPNHPARREELEAKRAAHKKTSRTGGRSSG
jgi:transposase